MVPSPVRCALSPRWSVGCSSSASWSSQSQGHHPLAVLYPAASHVEFSGLCPGEVGGGPAEAYCLSCLHVRGQGDAVDGGPLNRVSLALPLRLPHPPTHHRAAQDYDH